MSSVGVMASAIEITPVVWPVEIITNEPFNNFTDNGWTLSNTPLIVAGRTGTAMQAVGTTTGAVCNIPSAYQSDYVTCGAAFRWSDTSGIAPATIFRLAAPTSAIQFDLKVNPTTGVLDPGGLTPSAMLGLTWNQWAYIELQAYIHQTAGTVLVRVNGTTVINLTGVDTQAVSTTSLVSAVTLISGVSGRTHEWDDFYLRMGPGASFRADPNPPIAAPVVLNALGSTLSSSRSPGITFGANVNPLENDMVLFFPSSGATPPLPMTTPSGWVNVATVETSTVHQLCCFYHWVTAAEAAASTRIYTATNLYNANQAGNTAALLIRGVDTTTPIDLVSNVASAVSTTTPHTLPALTGTSLSNNSLVVGCVCKDGTGSYTTPSGWTLQVTVASSTQKCVYTRDALTVSGTNVSTTNVTPNAADEYASLNVALTKKP